jgi:hypothetical protein
MTLLKSVHSDLLIEKVSDSSLLSKSVHYKVYKWSFISKCPKAMLSTWVRTSTKTRS